MHGRSNARQRLARAKRLGEIPREPGLERLLAHPLLGSDQNGRDRTLRSEQSLMQLEAVDPWHAHVRDDAHPTVGRRADCSRLSAEANVAVEKPAQSSSSFMASRTASSSSAIATSGICHFLYARPSCSALSTSFINIGQGYARKARAAIERWQRDRYQRIEWKSRGREQVYFGRGWRRQAADRSRRAIRW